MQFSTSSLFSTVALGSADKPSPRLRRSALYTSLDYTGYVPGVAIATGFVRLIIAASGAAFFKLKESFSENLEKKGAYGFKAEILTNELKRALVEIIIPCGTLFYDIYANHKESGVNRAINTVFAYGKYINPDDMGSTLAPNGKLSYSRKEHINFLGFD